MKISALFAPIVLGLLLAIAPRSSAGILPFKDLVFTGTIASSPAVSSGKIVVTPITKQSLLAIFQVQSVPATGVVIAFDNDTGSFVLASKDLKTSYGSIIIPSSDSTSVNLFGKLGTQGRTFNSITLLNQKFTGYFNLVGTIKRLPSGIHQTVRGTFAGSGSLDGSSSPNAIISGTFSGSVNIPK